MKQRKKGFIIHDNFYEILCMLPNEDIGKLFLAIMEYHRENKLPQGFSMPLTMAFTMMKQAIDQDRIAYEKRCEASRSNGRLGGRPSQNETQKNLTKPKKADMDMDMDIDMDIDMDMGMGMDMGMEDHSSPFPVSDDPILGALSGAQKKKLQKEGVPLSYIEERQERARIYGLGKCRSAYEVLLTWWRQDQAKAKSEAPPSDKSYDLEEFFNAAVARFEREAGISEKTSDKS